MARLRGYAISVSVVMALVLSGCGDDEPDLPTAAEAEVTLKNHINRALEIISADDVKITNPGGRDIPCGDGRYKRTYAATARDRITSGDPNTLVLMLNGALDGLAEYEAVTTDLTRMDLANKRLHTKIILSSPGRHEISVQGETECLPAA
ncbi:hypothetical protein HNP84_003604 [Thermocatellispora tengchongensis]|uniref:Lipoprotein n=1 Tax=Thermocatellispora tengchongensis TaxID=1073253 RepID=A0A840P2G9_9ACTN|nr:hypothetical protein [Thermocatellispora tengchongensis]MBB5133878.1 hypothetical protein [Thermocatellispora tengchongensis]